MCFALARVREQSRRRAKRDRDVLQCIPHGTIWGNDDEGYGYDTVVLGQLAPVKFDIDALQARLDRPDHAAVKSSLDNVGMGSARGLRGAYAGRASALRPWLAGAELNVDRSLRLHYLAGLQLESSRGADANNELLTHCTFPDDIFTGTTESREALRDPLHLARPRP